MNVAAVWMLPVPRNRRQGWTWMEVDQTSTLINENDFNLLFICSWASIKDRIKNNAIRNLNVFHSCSLKNAPVVSTRNITIINKLYLLLQFNRVVFEINLRFTALSCHGCQRKVSSTHAQFVHALLWWSGGFTWVHYMAPHELLKALKFPCILIIHRYMYELQISITWYMSLMRAHPKSAIKHRNWERVIYSNRF